MVAPALIISICALFFTILSFWWLNWRRGKLYVSNPRLFAALGKNDLLLIEIPLIFFNNGAAPIIIENLKLNVHDEEEVKILDYIAILDKIGTDEGRTFASQFAVRGRDCVKLICEFQRRPGGFIFKAKSYKVDLMGKLSHKEKWKKLTSFDIKINEIALSKIGNCLLTYDNF